MPFSFFNKLVSFQGYTNKILMEMLDVIVVIYLDDILIFINETDHINSV